MPTIIDGSASATFATPLPLLQGGTGNTSGNVVSSQVADALNATGSAPLFACRAWVNFDGTSTVAIRASGNVSSITDNGTGNYTVNFTTALTDGNYAGMVSAGDYLSNTRSTGGQQTATRTATTYRVNTLNASQGALTDCDSVFVAIFR